jgi:nucleotide-binding universal stress UspA family protein
MDTSSPQPPLQPTSPATPTLSTNDHRKIAIAVDLSDESAYAVKWAVQNYLKPGDAVILLHVRPTTFLYGADWGSIQPQMTEINEAHQTFTEEQFENFITNKTNSLAKPLIDAEIPYKIHIVQDHDMKERLCLEVERLGLSGVIMGSRGFGAARTVRSGKLAVRLGSVSAYCVQHCVCPVVVVNYPDDEELGGGGAVAKLGIGPELELPPVPEEAPLVEEA